MLRALVVAAVTCACILGIRGAAEACSPRPCETVTVTSTTVSFVVSDMTSTALAGSTSVSATINFGTTNTGTGGTVVVTPTTLTAANGDTLAPANFTVTCKLTSGSSDFLSLGSVPLNGATTCATLAKNSSNQTAIISITLTLNDTAKTAPDAFDANASGQTFGPATFTVTATAS